MAIAMHQMGGLGILHRFMNVEQQVAEVEKVKAAGAEIISASIGVNGDYKERAQALVKAGVNLMTIDIAHGHSIVMMDTLKWLKNKYGDRLKSVVVHNDESHPHLHFTVSSANSGKLSSISRGRLATPTRATIPSFLNFLPIESVALSAHSSAIGKTSIGGTP